MDDLRQLTESLDNGGLESGLRFLNQRVGHRFTGIYRLQEMTLHNVELVDKTGSDLDHAGLLAVPLENSFCQFVLRDGVFRTSRTTGMDTLDGHPYQSVVESYVGLPLMSGPDSLYGTLCHFDFDEHPLHDEEFNFLQRAARLLPRYLQP